MWDLKILNKDNHRSQNLAWTRIITVKANLFPLLFNDDYPDYDDDDYNDGYEISSCMQT